MFIVSTCLSEKEELKGEGSVPFTLTQFKECYGLNLITVSCQGMIVKENPRKIVSCRSLDYFENFDAKNKR